MNHVMWHTGETPHSCQVRHIFLKFDTIFCYVCTYMMRPIQLNTFLCNDFKPKQALEI